LREAAFPFGAPPFGFAQGKLGRAYLFTNDCHENFSLMGRAPMFKQENALPGSELHFSIHNRYCLIGARQCHPDVRWHIIAALGTVREVIGIFRDQPIEKCFQVAARCGIGVLHNKEAATGVLNKNCHCPTSHPTAIDLRLHIFGDFVQSFTFGAKFELVVMDMHYIADY
jgi:hypothetical protein